MNKRVGLQGRTGRDTFKMSKLKNPNENSKIFTVTEIREAS